ncbi:MAG: hypothetical protein ABSE63_18850 [Thermoguttaceae bacterium]
MAWKESPGTVRPLAESPLVELRRGALELVEQQRLGGHFEEG